MCFLQLNETYQKPTILLKKSSNIYLVFNSKTFLSRIKSIYNFALSNVHLHILKCIHYSGITRSCRNSPLNNKQPNTKTKLGQCSSTTALTKVAIFINFYCYLHTLLSTILDKLPHVQFCYESKWDRIATVSTDFQEFFLFVSNETRGFDNDLWSREKKNWNEKNAKYMCDDGKWKICIFRFSLRFSTSTSTSTSTFDIPNQQPRSVFCKLIVKDRVSLKKNL